MQFVNRQLARNHHRDFGDLHGERQDVEAVEVLRAEVAETHLAFTFAGVFGKLGVNAFVDTRLQPLHFAIGDVEKISRAAGGIEHAEGVHPVAQFAQALESLRAFNLFGPRISDCRLDDLHDVGRGSEMRAKGVTFLVVHRVLEQRAEDFGLHLGPVELGGFAEQHEFLIVEF